MQYNVSDRVRVARVRIARGSSIEEIRSCWVALHPERTLVGIWTRPDAAEPTITARLVDVAIDWQEEEAAELPMPAA